MNNSAIKNENLDICSECGGKCCIKCGCDYAATDFSDTTYKGLIKELAVGDKSIVAFFKFKTLPNGKYIAEPFLYLRARNKNRDIVDLVSMKTRCSLLGENGCSYDYEHRPFGGKNLIPVRKRDGDCKPKVPQIDIINTWQEHQQHLRRIVKFYTGVSVEQKIRQDVEQLFFNILQENFDDVDIREKQELRGFVPMLIKAYPEECCSAKARAVKSGLKVYNKI